MTALLSGLWPAIIGAVLALVGIITALFSHKTAQVAKADAATATQKAADAHTVANQAIEGQKQTIAVVQDLKVEHDALAALTLPDKKAELQKEFGRE